MGRCKDCGEYTTTLCSSYGYVELCDQCAHKRDQSRIAQSAQSVKEPCDFESWDSGDMSELFWMHLGKYVKEPNAESCRYMMLAFHWACHDNHGIANSFDNALKWAGIDLFAEHQKWIEQSRKDASS